MKQTQISTEIEQRLQRVPKKVAGRLRGLLQLEHIDEHTINVVLDAGELAKDATFLADFATGYLYLRSQSIPVADVINMAKQHERKIHLMWSGKRWREEHERLSRYATLKALSENLVVYDVKWSDELPDFPGYVIKSSHRLGMEGLRQKHCVASYHQRIMSGMVLIAVVFFDKKRWTVELIRTSTSSDIRVGQIKTRYNGNPSPEQRKRICQMLGLAVNGSLDGVANQRELIDGEPSWRSCMRALVPVLEEQGVSWVCVTFSGYGDSGAIDDLDVFNHNNDSVLLKGNITYPKARMVYANGFYETEVDLVTESINDALEAMIYDWLESTNVDWYNNDGGQGELTIDFSQGLVDGYVDYNIKETERGHTEHISIDAIVHAGLLTE
jgi:hypothetical protein